MPSRTVSVQAVTGLLLPSISTKHRRQEAKGGVTPLKAHKFGILKPLSSATHKRLSPASALIVASSMVRLIDCTALHAPAVRLFVGWLQEIIL
jgi:hypothetical protein